jgi:hypothetical protein
MQTTQTLAGRPGLARTALAGVAAGVVFNVAGFLTFALIGSGLHNNGPLLDPARQSRKMIAVWTEIEPLPLFQAKPQVILLVNLLFGVVYALVFRSIAPAWPNRARARTWRLALTIWALSCLVFELLGPFNLLGEPLDLVALELVFWAVMALAAAATIVPILHGRSGDGSPETERRP